MALAYASVILRFFKVNLFGVEVFVVVFVDSKILLACISTVNHEQAWLRSLLRQAVWHALHPGTNNIRHFLRQLTKFLAMLGRHCLDLDVEVRLGLLAHPSHMENADGLFSALWR